MQPPKTEGPFPWAGGFWYELPPEFALWPAHKPEAPAKEQCETTSMEVFLR
jgi:hypothetical protein